MPTFENWKSDMISKSPQFQVWSITLELELTLLKCVQSLRQGDFQLYVDSLVNIVGGGGGVTQGCPYPISQIFYPPISHIPDFLPPNIPYPRFFTPQYPISQISQSIDHIPDFARLECVCIHSFDIQLVRMDPILLDIFIIGTAF